MAFRVLKFFGTFEKRAPGFKSGPLDPESNALIVRSPRLHNLLKCLTLNYNSFDRINGEKNSYDY